MNYLGDPTVVIIDWGTEKGSSRVHTFVLTVTIPACQTRDQELAYAEYACLAAARQARSAGGQVLSGTIQAQPNVLPGVQINLATYVYNPTAAS